MGEPTNIFCTSPYFFWKKSDYCGTHQPTICCRLILAHFPYHVGYIKRMLHIVANHQYLIGVFSNTHRSAIAPAFEVSGDVVKINALVFNDRISNTEHHVGIVRPIANLPSFPMSVLEYLLVVL